MDKKQKTFMITSDNIKYFNKIKVDYDVKFSDTLNIILDYLREHDKLTKELFNK